MHAMVLREAAAGKVEATVLPVPNPAPGQIRVQVRACGVCRTDLHVVDGELPEPKLPIVPGHEIVGTVDALGAGVEAFELGQRVGVPWLGLSCGECDYCLSGHENLCGEARYTGYQIDGGYADYCLADARYSFALPEGYSDSEAAPLLCAGLIGHRAYRMGATPGAWGSTASAPRPTS
jgi:propanol-preferring alcohol dehydrogenase